MKRIKEKHPLAIRWFHWVNFPVLAVMIYSGLLIYWANDEYYVGQKENPAFQFFPQPFYDLLDIPFNLAKGMQWHFAFMWIFILNGLIYVTYTAFSGEWKFLLPNKNSFSEAWNVVLHDIGIRKGEIKTGKFNGAQKIAYTSVIIMGAGSMLTGLAIYKPVQFGFLTTLCGGYKTARIIHFILTIGYVFFFTIHILQVIRAGWNNFRAMVTGFEIINEKTNDEI